MYVVVVRRGPDLNLTLASIRFDRWGANTRQPTILCDDWRQGLAEAHQQGYQHALFIDSGALFIDWTADQDKLLREYPYLIPVKLNKQIDWSDSFVSPKHAVDSSMFRDYQQLAQQQLWALNNEPVSLPGVVTNVLTPGSGLFWIMSVVQNSVRRVDIVDVSLTQIRFCRELWANWTGQDYGGFVSDFIQRHQVQHYQLDRPGLCVSRDQLAAYINQSLEQTFQQYDIQDFVTKWNWARATKRVNVFSGNLVQHVLNTGISDIGAIWCSNILNYKWTLLNSTAEDCEKFLTLVQSKKL